MSMTLALSMVILSVRCGCATDHLVAAATSREQKPAVRVPPGAAQKPVARAATANEQLAANTASPANAEWEMHFASGLLQSETAVAAKDAIDAGRWAADDDSSRAGVPVQMLEAEKVMATALEMAPEGKARKDKLAVYALRLYNHAKWLAELNHATAAESRYLKAKEFAQLARRSVLAGHALSRLGYFLMNWGRHDEARVVLEESFSISKKSNPLAPYLLGVLDRRAAAAVADVERLHAADARILLAEPQPSKDLEDQRIRLVDEIRFWKEAQASPERCIESRNAAHVIICFASHIALAVQHVWA